MLENIEKTATKEVKYLFKEYYKKLQISENQFENFEKLKTDDERICFVNEIVSFKELPPIKVIKSNKDENLALKLKESGNKAFGKGDFETALKNYSESILKMTQNNDTKNLALALANRSAAFYNLQLYNLAINDIDLVLQLNYPQELKYKVYERKAKSLLALKKHKDGVAEFKKTLQALDDCKLPLEKKFKMQKNIQIMLQIMSKSNNKNDNLNVETIQNKNKNYKPHLIYEKNKIFESASDKIEIKKDSTVGRYASASENICPGETILIEKPYCSVLLEDYHLIHCQHCFKRTQAPYPCENCSEVIFCSLDCRESANYHKYECSILQTLHKSGVSITVLMALRIITQNSLKYFLDLKPKLAEEKKLDVVYKSSDYLTVYNLVRHKDLRETKDFFERTVMALFLLRCLKLVNYFKNTDNFLDILSDDEIFIGGLILRHLQILQFNAHEISELEMENKNILDNSKSLFIGGGLYPTLALFNHSCDPGIVRYFIGTEVIVRAAKPIKKGEIVAENYGPIYSQIKKQERQEKLKSQYWFECACNPCLELWPTFDELDTKTIRFRCAANGIDEKQENCKNILLVPVNTDDFMIKCSQCNQHTNLFKGLKALQDTDILYQQAIKDAQTGNFQAALEIYFEILSTLHKILAPPFRDYLLCQQSIRKCMLALGNTF